MLSFKAIIYYYLLIPIVFEGILSACSVSNESTDDGHEDQTDGSGVSTLGDPNGTSNGVPHYKSPTDAIYAMIDRAKQKKHKKDKPKTHPSDPSITDYDEVDGQTSLRRSASIEQMGPSFSSSPKRRESNSSFSRERRGSTSSLPRERRGSTSSSNNKRRGSKSSLSSQKRSSYGSTDSLDSSNTPPVASASVSQYYISEIDNGPEPSPTTSPSSSPSLTRRRSLNNPPNLGSQSPRESRKNANSHNRSTSYFTINFNDSPHNQKQGARRSSSSSYDHLDNPNADRRKKPLPPTPTDDYAVLDAIGTLDNTIGNYEESMYENLEQYRLLAAQSKPYNNFANHYYEDVYVSPSQSPPALPHRPLDRSATTLGLNGRSRRHSNSSTSSTESTDYHLYNFKDLHRDYDSRKHMQGKKSNSLQHQRNSLSDPSAPPKPPRTHEYDAKYFAESNNSQEEELSGEGLSGKPEPESFKSQLLNKFKIKPKHNDKKANISGPQPSSSNMDFHSAHQLNKKQKKPNKEGGTLNKIKQKLSIGNKNETKQESGPPIALSYSGGYHGLTGGKPFMPM